MSEALRPSTLGEILDRTAQLYRRNFWMFTGVAALPIGVIFAITAVAVAIIFAIPGIRASSDQFTPIMAVAIILAVVIVIPIYIVAAVFSYAGMTEAAARVSRGETITIRRALASVKPRFWRCLGFIFLQGLIAGGLPAGAATVLIVVLVAIGAAAGGGGASIAAGFLAVIVGIVAFVAIVWLMLSFSLGLPACVVENLPPWDSLMRSWKLSPGTRGRVLLMYLLVFALSIALSMVAAIPVLIIVGVASAAGHGQSQMGLLAAEVIRFVVDFLLQVLLAPVSAIALVLFYYDQRIRKEGFDIEWMMQQAGLAQPTPTAPAPPSAGVSWPVAPPDTVE
ncbi:MAG TPA: hypothetical protein VMT38_01065 [Terracidiphilus sp.]|nr:hypothetical protein [Terracidiphilus sp.]